MSKFMRTSWTWLSPLFEALIICQRKWRGILTTLSKVSKETPLKRTPLSFKSLQINLNINLSPWATFYAVSSAFERLRNMPENHFCRLLYVCLNCWKWQIRDSNTQGVPNLVPKLYANPDFQLMFSITFKNLIIYRKGQNLPKLGEPQIEAPKVF